MRYSGVENWHLFRGANMKKLLIASVAAFSLSASSAFAADLGHAPAPAYKAPPLPPPALSWTGCYIAGGVGYGLWNQRDYDVTSPPAVPSGVVLTPTVNTGGEGWLGRLGGGCDYQFGVGSLGNFVIGAFADYDFTNFTGTFQDPFTTFVGQEKESGSWAVGGRIGYLVTPDLLGYFDGGYTQARFDSITLFVPFAPPGLTYPSQTSSGWFLGGGTEYALNMSWVPIHGLFWRTEYRYNSYDAANVPVSFVGIPFGLASHMQKNVQTVTSGLVWRFNFGGPVAARY